MEKFMGVNILNSFQRVKAVEHCSIPINGCEIRDIYPGGIFKFVWIFH